MKTLRAHSEPRRERSRVDLLDAIPPLPPHRRIGRGVLAGLALSSIIPVAGCGTQEPPKVIDTTTPAKQPVAQPASKVDLMKPEK